MVNALGINLWNWTTVLNEDCCGLPDKIRKLGFTAIELPMTTTEIPLKLKEEIIASGLRVSLCASLGPGRDLSNFDEDVRKSTMEYLKNSIKNGSELGAEVFCGPLYTGGGKKHWLDDDKKKREWDYAVTGLKTLSYYAKEYGIKISLEPLNRYRTSVANTVKQVLDMIEDIDAENVGLHYDTYHACLEEKNLIDSLEYALRSGKLNHFHACSNNRGAPGQGIIPWNTVFDKLVEYGYQGHITMETFAFKSLDSSWINVHGDPDELAKTGITYLKNYFGKKQI